MILSFDGCQGVETHLHDVNVIQTEDGNYVMSDAPEAAPKVLERVRREGESQGITVNSLRVVASLYVGPPVGSSFCRFVCRSVHPLVCWAPSKASIMRIPDSYCITLNKRIMILRALIFGLSRNIKKMEKSIYHGHFKWKCSGWVVIRFKNPRMNERKKIIAVVVKPNLHDEV